VPTIDSVFVGPGDDVPPDVDLAADVVVKPSVGAGSNGVVRPRGDVAAALRHVGELHRSGLTAMIQPYVADIDTDGETGLVYLAGAFSHAFAKSAILTKPIAWEGGLYAEESVEPRRATRDQLAVGEIVMSELPPTAYARIDLLPTASGPAVLEVELTEPSLFLEHDEDSPQRAAAAFRSLTA
jgi:glutathione synthase/RimK-type ligase-like ATP-grasp enzyme